MKKAVILLLGMLLSAVSLSARVKYTPEMEGFLGTWEYQISYGYNAIFTYQISISDGWVVVRQKIDHGNPGGLVREINIKDYTYSNGILSFDDSILNCRRTISLKLQEGSLVETIHSDYQGESDKSERVYEKSF